MGPGLLVGAIYGIIQLSVGYVLTPAQASQLHIDKINCVEEFKCQV